MDDPGLRRVVGACVFCRIRKLRCDKQLPRCQTCIRSGRECTYTSRQQPRRKRTHAQELEERLGHVESLLRASRAGQDGSNHRPSSNLGHGNFSMMESHGTATLLNAETLVDLEKVYFEDIHPIMPIIHCARYTSFQTLDVGAWPPLYLRYAIWAVAAHASEKHSHRSSEYYKMARHLTEEVALVDPKLCHSAISCAQAWLHLAMYDNISGRYSLSWANTGHAIRLLQAAKVHNLDSTRDTSTNPTSQNVKWCEAEEKRRAFWFAFCLDRIAFIGQGLPSMIDEKDIEINLPASDEAYQSSTEEPTLTLSQATAFGETHTLCPMSAIAVIYSLCGSKMKYLQQLDVISIQDMLASSDWLKSDSIGESLTATYRIPAHLTVTKDNIEANLLFLNFMVHCATICVHRMAQKIVQTSSSPLRAKFVQQSASQCVAAASTVFRLTELAIQSNLRNYHPATSLCIYYAVVSFADWHRVKRDTKYIAQIRFLIDFLISLRNRSQLACSVVRDLETEYPSLMIELRPPNGELYVEIGVDEGVSQSPQGDVATHPWLANDALNDISIRNSEEGSSSVTMSMPYGWTEAQCWDSQMMDTNYMAQFDFSMDG